MNRLLMPLSPLRLAGRAGRAGRAGVVALLCVAASALAQTAPGLARYEAELDAIRQALLKSTLENAPTRVISTAWIDAQGQLHENTQFASEARVRGVRVLAYLQEPAVPGAPPPVVISTDALPAGMGPRASSLPAACAGQTQRWRQPLRLVSAPVPGLRGEQAHVGQVLLGLASQAWLDQMQASQRWRAERQPDFNPSAYERALLGPPEESGGWQAVLELAPLSPTPPNEWQRLGWQAPPAGWEFELRLSISHPLAPDALWRVAERISISAAARAAGPAQWTVALADELQARMSAWRQRLDTLSACEPMQFDLAAPAGPLQLLAGSRHGLRLGDRLLIMDRRHLPQRVLEPGAAQHLALVEVQQLSAGTARLRQLAGPTLAGRGDWVALPF